MNKENKITIIIVTVVLAIICLGTYFAYEYKDDILEIFVKEEKTTSNDVEQSKVIKSEGEGVYLLDVSDVVKEAMPSIVAITSKTLINQGYLGPFGGSSGYALGAGSGIIIDENEKEILILTNNHVVNNSSELSVSFVDEKTADASILGVSERRDIAVISVKKSSLEKETLSKIRKATIGDSEKLEVGVGIIAIGNALGYGQSVTTGVVSALNRVVTSDSYSMEMIQIDAAINGGNSGGALLNKNGEVVGINSAKYSNNNAGETSIEGMGFAIPINDVKELIEKLKSGKNDDSKITIGIEGYMTNSEGFTVYNMPVGFYIANIMEDSYADESELEIGNIITEIDGKKVDNFNVISNILYTKDKNDEITLKVSYVSKNEYKEKTVKIKFD